MNFGEHQLSEANKHFAFCISVCSRWKVFCYSEVGPKSVWSFGPIFLLLHVLLNAYSEPIAQRRPPWHKLSTLSSVAPPLHSTLLRPPS